MDLSKLGRRLSDIEAEFSFGDIPEGNVGPPDCDVLDADAVNDETFGADVGPSNVELEDYAAQTACLRMDDGWEQPGCSATAPDASQLPMPQFDIAFGRSSFDAFSNDDILPATGSSLDKMDALWNTSTNGVFNLWGGGNSTGNQSKKMTEHSFGNFDLPSVDLPKSRPEAEIRRPAPPPMPIEAHTLDELERLYVEATREKEQVVPQCEFETSSLSALSVAINVADLEKSVSEDVVKPSKHETTPQMPSVGTGLPFSPMGIPPGPLPFFPPVPPMFMPFMGVWMDFLSGKIAFLPPGFPPVPPPVFVMFRHMRSGMPPGIGPICPPHGPMGPQTGGVQQGLGDYQRRPLHRRVAPGMPSGKTIEDFAFDPYAGFMSCKEREWLVRIQILQCQGQTGDPFEDDYYYASWREKRLAAGWRPKNKENIKENGEKGRTLLREKDRNRGEDRNREYKAPKFAGSLGKPVTSTVYNPRHLIDVSGDNQEDKKSATQKKLRTMLLKLESAAILLMDCVDKRRPLAQQPHIAEKVASDISERVNLVIKELFTVDQISKTVQLTKGRTVLRKLLAIAFPKQLVQIVITLFGALSGFQKKTYTEVSILLRTKDFRKKSYGFVGKLSTDLLPAIHIALSRFHREQLMYVTSTVDGRLMEDVIEQKNAFARDILFVLLLWVARRRATSSDSIFQWLRSRDEVQWDGDGWSHPIVDLTGLIHLNTEDIANISEWLRLLSADPKAATVASRLASALSP